MKAHVFITHQSVCLLSSSNGENPTLLNTKPITELRFLSFIVKDCMLVQFQVTENNSESFVMQVKFPNVMISESTNTSSCV